jgi:hypothetical protein
MNTGIVDVTEQKRLNDAREAGIPWKKWDFYLDSMPTSCCAWLAGLAGLELPPRLAQLVKTDATAAQEGFGTASQGHRREHYGRRCY